MLVVLCSVFCVLCFVFCVLCFVFCVLCFVFCVLCFVLCVVVALATLLYQGYLPCRKLDIKSAKLADLCALIDNQIKSKI
jgi:hypothetical protein